VYSKAPLLRPLLLLGLATALSGSLWALLSEKCTACSQSAELVGGLNLGAIGGGYYALLLIAALVSLGRRPGEGSSAESRLVRGGILFAGGVHLTLVTMLLRNRIFCPPCLLTAAGAFIGAFAVLALDPRHLARVTLLVALIAVMTYGGTKILRHFAATTSEIEATRAERLLLREQSPPPDGRARMVVYEWPSCHFCMAFRARVLPPLRKEFGSRLALEERKAWKGMAVPTVIVLGQRNSRLIGYHPLGSVRQAVRLACGDSEMRGLARNTGQGKSLIQ
jgi:hypothetical protein